MSRDAVAGKMGSTENAIHHTHRAACAATVWVVLLVLAGCGKPSDRASSRADRSEQANAAQTEIERGPVRVSVHVAPHPARLSDEPRLTLTLDYQRGVTIQKPPFGEAMGDFQIRDYRSPLPETKGDREILRQVYTLEPTRTGQLQIDPIAVTFTDSRPDGDGKQHTLETEALTIEVTSIVADDAPSLDDLQGLAGPVQLPEPAGTLPWWLLGGIPLTLLAIGVGWAVWRRRRRPPERQMTPRELAYLELDQLIRQKLSDRDVKLFYVHLTGIVRRFIERTTGIHAAEQTTEEFLREIGRGQVFGRAERERLAAFLESADLVKFAALEPSARDIENTFLRAKAFLGLDTEGGTG
jgi:hypothetical protein